MKDFKIEIRETLLRDIEVKADSYEEALEKVKDLYYESEIVLYADDFVRVQFVRID
ncbi:MAG: DpnD/PcfM family protein [Peptoniphilus rhinitidis]|uniref:DpnD/PcfM family protein n=1 Tax=Peptoniphilus rhinitidis TaxID=1175452 RepID=UPI0029016C09|nr:DpnD/PcfM family protein [Peptoniphilus rhinitidis]MDU2109026.1 DpnD/PcfM family protein [Peptoniphilus lacydonensis]MDU3750122.1 DpnD/PcfM family protein [Peptoniphilus rhinitidis]